MKKVLTIIILFVFTSTIFANPILDEKNKIIDYDYGIESHRHSIGVDFAPTVFSMITAPTLMNVLFKQPNNIKTLNGTFGLGIVYTYRVKEKVELDAMFNIYAMDVHYTNKSKFYFGSTVATGLSIGARFYFNKHDRASGFFLAPKFGVTFFNNNGTEFIYPKPAPSPNNEEPVKPTEKEKKTFIYDFYVSGEMGFRIDLTRSFGVAKGVRPFLDISILELGYSYNHFIRFVPLPRFAIGVLF